jgi:hypothetical protein
VVEKDQPEHYLLRLALQGGQAAIAGTKRLGRDSHMQMNE